MTWKGFLALCVAAVAAVVLAVVAVLQQPSPRTVDVSRELLFPGLGQALNTVKSVAVKGDNGAVTLDWNGKVWTVRERKGYPADEAKISAAVLQMARMVTLEAKTAAADRLVRLQLDDPTAKGSHAKQISVLDQNGKVIAELVVGKRKFTLGGSEGGTYVRRPGNTQSWLALGELNVTSDPGDWLKRSIIDVAEHDVKRVSVTHPNGEKVVVGKTMPSELNFKVENLPAGKLQASASAANDFGRVVSTMVLEDVAKADEVAFPKDKTTVAEVETFGGMQVTLEVTEKDGKSWVRAKAAPPPAAAPVAEAKPGETLTPPAPRTDWGKLASEINARADGWVFELPNYQVAPLQKRMGDLVLKPDPKS